MKAMMQCLYRPSRGLQKIAEKKSLLNLTAVADANISANSFMKKQYDPDEVAEVQETGLQQGVTLMLKATKWDAVRGTRIWVVEISEIFGIALFFFVGTYQEVSAKLRDLPAEE